MSGVLDPDRWSLTALTVVATVLVAATFLVSSPTVRYGTWLAVFTVWMLLFVLAAVRWLRNAKV